MNQKHFQTRIKQCLILAESSGCPRRKFGAMLVDPTRNVVLADGYNGGPRGQPGTMCRGTWCERDGLKPGQVEVRVYEEKVQDMPRSPPKTKKVVGVEVCGSLVWKADHDTESLSRAEAMKEELVASHPPVDSGTKMEMGCHHAESNVICNAAANGIKTGGSWLIVTGEPCMMCSKLIHHAGIERVVCVENGYRGGRSGVEYLTRNGVEVTFESGPMDPRI